MRHRLMFLFITLVAQLAHGTVNPDAIDLSGLWRFQLDPAGYGMVAGSELYKTKLPDTIVLPGSTDEAGKGVANTAAYVDRLSRRHEYTGQAWYQREVVIPESWSGKRIELELERCHWTTTVYVDGKPAGSDDRVSTPNRFVLSDMLTPGVHTLTLCVDNTIKYPMDKWAHGFTDHTQTNWNGVVGRMQLTATPVIAIERLNLYPDPDNRLVKVKVDVSGTEGEGLLDVEVSGPTGATVGRKKVMVRLPADSAGVTFDVAIASPIKLWDEFTPNLYTLSATLETGQDRDSLKSRFGMRKVEKGRHHIRINGRDVHLRGVLECAVFPLTGYPSTDPEVWMGIMNTVKEYGMNHVRFHSWCPPEAAFDAADSVGIYLQVELPMWIKDVGRYPSRRDFFEKEMYAILDEYGNHPSFVLYCNGNENEGDFSVLEDLIEKGKRHDPRHLYSASTARTHVKADDYFDSHVSSAGWQTVYEGRPSTDWDINQGSDIDVPVIAHETGQRCMYPDFSEMKKYTGVLEPRNFGVFRDRLARNGMLSQAEDFFKATGSHTVLQYKDVNEALLRSDKSGGFQLLGLTDFPGQGSAFVGILDAFWDSKGLVSPAKFRESCAPVVLLARMPKRVYVSDDTLKAGMEIYNFGGCTVPKGKMSWRLTTPSGETIDKGYVSHGAVPDGCVDSLGHIAIGLGSLQVPGQFVLHASMPGGLHNEWNIWVYPSRHDDSDVAVPVTSWTEARRRLERGENVFLIPDSVPGRHTRFASHFWNPVMFDWDPMIVGTLIHDSNGAFRDFPTGNYADWQWHDILEYGTALDLTGFRELTPVIQSIDTYEENRKLGIAFEARVGNGNLFVLCVDPSKDIDRRPSTRQLIRSVGRYVASDRFQPGAVLTPLEVEMLLTRKPVSTGTSGSEAALQLLNR